MCYSGKCCWENHMGDCTFGSYYYLHKYIDMKSASSLKCFNNTMFERFQEIKKNKYLIDERKLKINKIKSKLL